MPASRQMSDEQRKAMFARMGGGGGGGGGSQAPSRPGSILPGGVAGPGESPGDFNPYDTNWRPTSDAAEARRAAADRAANQARILSGRTRPTSQTMQDINARLRAAGVTVYDANKPVSRWDKFKAAVGGFFEGAKGGSSILADKLTFGATDAVGITESDKYQGADYDISRAAASVAQTALTTAVGIGAIDKVGKAFQATKLASTAIGKMAAPITAVGGFGVNSAIDDYRAENPTLNPYADKALAVASEIAGFIGATGAVGTLAKSLALVGKIPVSAKLSANSISAVKKAFSSIDDAAGIKALSTFSAGGRATVSTAGKAALHATDKVLAAAGRGTATALKAVSNKVLGKTLTAGSTKALKSAASAYQKVAGFTGSTLKEVMNAPKAAGKLREASKLTKQAAALRSSASSLKVTEGYKAMKLEAAAAKKLASAEKYTAAGRSAAANKAHREAIGLLWQADDVTRAAAKSAGKLTKDAAKLATRAAGLASEGKAGLAAAGYAAGISGAVTYAEEKGLGRIGEKLGLGKGIETYKKEAKTAYKAGEKYQLAADSVRSPANTVLAASVGTLGNPIEKISRQNWAKEQSEMGAYRAKYELIGESLSKGRISKEQADAAYAKLAQQKPMKVAGRGAWDIAPAMASYVKWRMGNAIDAAKRSTIDVRPAGSYADADTLHVGSGTVRMSDMNAPEVAHGRGANQIERQTGEYLGEEAAARIRQLVKEGQYVRLVEDSNPKAGGIDKYGRAVRTVETLPKPFDHLLRIPGVGKIIPARDVNKTLIREGLADIHYRELSGRTDRAEAYDKAREAARAEGRGIWSPEAQAAYADYARSNPSYQPWIGTEKTVAERQAELYRRTHGGAEPPQRPATRLGNFLGSGLMYSGNSGAFDSMPSSGGAIATTWNAVLAALGAIGYNENAAYQRQMNSSPMTGIPTDYAAELAALQRAQQARIDALNQ